MRIAVIGYRVTVIASELRNMRLNIACSVQSNKSKI